MNTIVYLIRHSEKLYMQYIDRYYDDENYQITREKRILSAEGERKANILSKQKEFDKVDVIYSSSYVRTIQTAKYLAERLDKKIHVNRNLNERKYGNPKYAEDISLKQYYDEKIKNIEGESRKEVTVRMYKTFMNIIDKNKGKTIAIFSHGAAISFLLMKWCKLVYIDSYIRYSYYELKVKDNLSEKEINEVLRISRNYFENKGYKVYFTNAEFEYQNARKKVESNEYMIAFKE